MKRQGDGATARRGDGAAARRGDGAAARRGDGETARRGDGATARRGDGSGATPIRRIWDVLVGIARELSDETPYRRHLESHGRAHSPEEWRRFLEERLRAKYTQPRCC